LGYFAMSKTNAALLCISTTMVRRRMPYGIAWSDDATMGCDEMTFDDHK
jgi:hypothetical protein